MCDFTIDEISLTADIGFGKTIKLNQDALIRVHEKKSGDIGNGVSFYIESGLYVFFCGEITIKLTDEEANSLIMFAADISPPAVQNDICTLCDGYVVSDIHKGCKKRKLKMGLFAVTPFGKKIIKTFIKLVTKKVSEDKVSFRRGMAHVQRKDLIAAMDMEHNALFRYGPFGNANECILKFDGHFRNFKALVVPFVNDHIKLVKKISDDMVLEILDLE